MAQGSRAKPKYVPAWMTKEQYEKLQALKVLRRTSINVVLCELIDHVDVQIILPSDLQKTKNGAGVRQDMASAALS